VSALLTVFRSRRMATLAVLGFTSGLPLLLSGATLRAWMTNAGVDLKTITAFTLVHLPFNLKPFWAPLLDRYALPWLDLRRGWAVVFQAAIVACVALMSTLDPSTQRTQVALLAVGMAFLAASQDIVLDAYRTEVLEPHERGAGSAIFLWGYRIAVVLAQSGTLILADFLPWRVVYLSMAIFMVPGFVVTVLAASPKGLIAPRRLRDAFVQPVLGLWRKDGIKIALLFIATYKLGEQLLDPVTFPFMSRTLGFSNTEISLFSKVCGLIGATIGGAVAGIWLARLRPSRALLIMGAFQAATNLGYAALAVAGPSRAGLAAVVTIDNVGNIMGSTAWMAYMTALCDPGTSGAQYALLTGLASIIGRSLGPSSGALAERLGWPTFFVLTAVAAIPGLLLTFALRDRPAEGAKA
jgi:MFS transporter, PAT family, beta-lactamase induction signal transducer AmpG